MGTTTIARVNHTKKKRNDRSYVLCHIKTSIRTPTLYLPRLQKGAFPPYILPTPAAAEMLAINGQLSLAKPPVAKVILPQEHQVAKSTGPAPRPPVHVRLVAPTDQQLASMAQEKKNRHWTTHRSASRSIAKQKKERPPLEKIFPREKTIDIYTDGSHIKGSFRRGWGAWAVWGDREYEMSCCSNDLHESISNPTLELMAAVQVLEFLRGKFPPDVERVRIIADYTGVQKYGMLLWQPEKSKVAHFRGQAERLRDISLAYRADQHEGKPGCPIVEFLHVHGHSGIAGNEHADRLAKSNQDYNTFDLFIATAQSAAVPAACRLDEARTDP